MATYGKDEVRAAVKVMKSGNGTLVCVGGQTKDGETVGTAGKVFAGVVGAASHLAWHNDCRLAAGLKPRATASGKSLDQQAADAIAALDA